MKSVFLVVLLGFFAASLAQQNTSGANVRDLTIIKAKLGRIVCVDVARSDPPPAGIDDFPRFSSNPPDVRWQGKAELEVRNTGSRSIKYVEWEFTLVEANAEQKSYRIQSKKTIQPGQTVTLTGWFEDKHLNELRKRGRKTIVQEQAEIRLVRFENGKVSLPLKIKPRPQG